MLLPLQLLNLLSSTTVTPSAQPTVSTSGTISTTQFATQQIVDHAFRRAKVPPEKISGEYIDTALDLLYLILSGLARRGIALWAIDDFIVPMYESVARVPAPLGTVDIFQANLRTSQTITGTPTSSSGVAANAFDGTLQNSCIQTAPGGWIDLALPNPLSAIPTYGIMPNASGTWGLSITCSTNNGLTYGAPIWSSSAFAAVAGQWQWFDIEGTPDNVTNIRLNATSTTTLSVRQLCYQTVPNEIPCAKLSRDDYINLPDKFFQGRPVQYWYDKQIPQPQLVLWPVPQFQFTFAQMVITVQRYVMDVGTMTQIIEAPQRWYLPIICELAKELSMEIPESQADPVTLSAYADKMMTEAWDSETDQGPIMLRAKISPYTRC